jgi:hypothetical protein
MLLRFFVISDMLLFVNGSGELLVDEWLLVIDEYAVDEQALTVIVVVYQYAQLFSNFIIVINLS